MISIEQVITTNTKKNDTTHTNIHSTPMMHSYADNTYFKCVRPVFAASKSASIAASTSIMLEEVILRKSVTSRYCIYLH